MFVSGFTIVRNAIKFDYPVVASIKSVLPIVDEMVVCLGKSDDDTESLIRSINSPKIRIVASIWNDSLREGGKVLAIETNKAFDAISPNADWALYIQGDEVLHEKYHSSLLATMKQWQYNPEVEGLLFDYLHFYGHYRYVADSRKWYRNEIRVIRNDKNIRSYKDAQGFRKDGRKLQVKKANATMFHYGWVKNPIFQKEKEKEFNKLWHSDEWMQQNVSQADAYDYDKIDSLSLFSGEHPKVMLPRIAQADWDYRFDITKKKFKPKDRFLYEFERLTGKRLFEYKNYKLL